MEVRISLDLYMPAMRLTCVSRRRSFSFPIVRIHHGLPLRLHIKTVKSKLQRVIKGIIKGIGLGGSTLASSFKLGTKILNQNSPMFEQKCNDSHCEVF